MMSADTSKWQQRQHHVLSTIRNYINVDTWHLPWNRFHENPGEPVFFGISLFHALFHSLVEAQNSKLQTCFDTSNCRITTNGVVSVVIRQNLSLDPSSTTSEADPKWRILHICFQKDPGGLQQTGSFRVRRSTIDTECKTSWNYIKILNDYINKKVYLYSKL